MAEEDIPDGESGMEEVALAGSRTGKSQREIAVDLYGAERVVACWHADSRMRATVRRLVHRARTASGAGPGGTGHGTP